MRSVLDFGKGLYLVDGEFLQFGTGLKFLNFDDFDGNGLVCLFVDCSVYFSELSLSDDVV